MPRIWDPNPDYDAAVEKFNVGDLAGALPCLEAAAVAQPARARIHSNLAVALLSLGRDTDARTPAERGAQLADADDPYPAVVLAETLHALEDDAAALAAADEALAYTTGTPPDRFRAQLVRAWSLVRLDRVREATAAAHEAVVLAPGHPAALLAYAVALASGYRWGEAMAAVELALALDPEDEDLLRRREVIARGVETAKQAAATARAEAEAAPDDWQRWLTLGTALTMAGHLEEAAAAFDAAHEHNPDSADRWPDDPQPLSPWEADCRQALQEHAAAAAAAAASGAGTPPR
jgi:tetratricopeptide (TPR) repeat protein